MHGQIANLGMFAEEFSGLELVLEDFGEVFDILAGSRGHAVFFDRVGGFVPFAHATREEAVLTQVHVEASQATVSGRERGGGR